VGLDTRTPFASKPGAAIVADFKGATAAVVVRTTATVVHPTSDPTAVAYNLAFAWRLSGPLNKPALAKTLRAVVERHESLRTTFVESDGQPSSGIPIPDVELTMVHLEEAELMHRLTREAQRPFNLAHGVASRASVVCRNRRRCFSWSCITSSVMAFDECLVPRIAHVLSSVRPRRAAILPPLPFQYADFAVLATKPGYVMGRWKSNSLIGNQQLSGHLPMLELPSDRARSAQRSSAVHGIGSR